MALYGNPDVTGVEKTFDRDELIVSKTDLAGKITYGNRTFYRLAGYDEAELMGAPHNIIRHPDMPRAVFELLWQTIKAGEEIFAYVVNRSRNGDHYWVFAHVTPSRDANGDIVGYHSNRRVPNRNAVDAIVPIYRDLIATEKAAAGPREGMQAAVGKLTKLLEEKQVGYNELILSLEAS